MQHSTFEQTAASPSTNDYYVLPATEKQIRFARSIAQNSNVTLPDEALTDRRRISSWIDKHKTSVPKSKFSNYPSSKQVAFAERIARIKQRDVPHKCFRDRTLMSKWIDTNI